MQQGGGYIAQVLEGQPRGALGIRMDFAQTRLAKQAGDFRGDLQTNQWTLAAAMVFATCGDSMRAMMPVPRHSFMSGRD
jgi:hypothetical protein